MVRKLICPLTRIFCAKEKCAWWVKDDEGCSVLSISDALVNIELILDVTHKITKGASE